MTPFLHGMVRAVAESFDLPAPILEVGAYQVEETKEKPTVILAFDPDPDHPLVNPKNPLGDPGQKPSATSNPRAIDLADQLADYRIGEGVEILYHQQESAGPTNDILFVVVRKAAGWLGVHGETGPGLGVDDRQTIDRDALLDRLVASVGDGWHGIAGAVARNIDDHSIRFRRG